MVYLIINSVLESRKYISSANHSTVVKMKWHNIYKAL